MMRCRNEGDYLIPNLTITTEEKQPLGIRGQRHLRYLKQVQGIKGKKR